MSLPEPSTPDEEELQEELIGLLCGRPLTPDPSEPLGFGIRWATEMAKDPFVPTSSRKDLLQWAEEACKLLEKMAADLAVAAIAPKCYGATCKSCNEFNEYAEAKADFVCYGCRI